MNQRRARFVYVCLITLVSAFVFLYHDLKVNANWGIILLDCIKEGDLRHYAEIVEVKFPWAPTNYSIFANISTAIWLLPVYLADHLFDLTLPIAYYGAWYKVMILLVTGLTVSRMGKILTLLGTEKEDVENAKYLFLISPMIQLGLIGVGQVDFFVNFFIVSIALAFLEKKESKMAWLVSLSLIFKPFAFLMYIPLLLLLYYKEPKKMIGQGLKIMSVPLLMKILGKTYFINYDVLQSRYQRAFHFPERIFPDHHYMVSLFVVLYCIICYVCAVKCSEGKVKKTDYLIYPFAAYLLFLTTVDWSSHWGLYVVFFLILFGQLRERKQDFHILYGVMGIAYPLYVVCRWPKEFDVDLISNGLLNTFLSHAYKGHELAWFINDKIVDTVYAAAAMKSVFLAAVILSFAPIVYRGYKEKKKEESVTGQMPAAIRNAWMWAQAIPYTVFVLAIFVLFFHDMMK